MKKLINRIKTSIWLYPVIYSLFAIILAIGVTLIDKAYADEMSKYLNNLVYTSSSLAQAVLGIVANAFITIAIFTFSTTMVVLTMYTSQFTPRVVENFLNNKVTMKSYGVFLSGFIYAITSLLFINIGEEGNVVIVASVGVIYVIVGLVYFIIFIQSVSNHVQANDLISRLHEEASEKIREYVDFVSESKIISEEKMLEIVDNKNCVDVFGQSDGYIQEVDFERLERTAQDYNYIIRFEKVVGQFITTETRIYKIYIEGHNPLDDEALNEIHACTLVGNKKTQTQDFSFTIQKIVEIAVKALSPGINDPNTAIHCLKIIGVLLRDLAKIEKGYAISKEKDESSFIISEAYDFEILLYDAYNQIMFYGQSDVSIVIAGLKSLRFVRDKASWENIRSVDDYAKHLFEKQVEKGYSKLEYSKIQNEYNDLIF